MNLEFLVVALIISKAIDWVFQTKWQAENKTHNLEALFEHCIWYATLTTMITFGLVFSTFLQYTILNVFMILFVTHMIIDTRLPSKLIMMIKGLTWEEANSKEYAWLDLELDQILHTLVILYIASVIV